MKQILAQTSHLFCHVLIVLCIGELRTAANATEHELWYNQPARKWNEALPVGNGSLGAMVFGGAEEARFQFNDDTLWRGSPHDYSHAGASAYLDEIRSLLFAGRQREAEALASEHFMSRPLRQMPFQPCGDLILRFPGHSNCTDYRRSLNLEEAVATTEYTVNGVTYQRTCFASYPAKALIVRLTASRPAALSLSARLETPHEVESLVAIDGATIVITGSLSDRPSEEQGDLPNRMRFAAHLLVLDTDGNATSSSEGLKIESATQATLLLTTGTNFTSYKELSADPVERSLQKLSSLNGADYEDLEAAHIADYQSLFTRVSLDLGGDSRDTIPTDKRILANETTPEPALAALLFDYGRYLLISSSRSGSQPANLQGLWNDQLAPPWGSKYTTNINAEMNYWLAESCNLAECTEPLFAMLEEVAESGRKTARAHYDAPGWVLHHNTDLWRGTAPINASNHGIWPTGGAWLCQHLWWHYLYTLDREFLEHRAYPLMKGAAEFFADCLVEDPRNDHHWLISGPSNSPEQGGLVMGPTMDHQIIRHLFASTAQAANILGKDSDFVAKLESLQRRIAPNQIGRLGQLQEWLEDVDDPNNRHRHSSHLWGLFPGEEITPSSRFYPAARKSLEMRGNGGTGWARAWKINLWARLHDGEQAYDVLQGLLKLSDSPLTDYTGGGVYPNLFDVHPPFQIDGNFGASSGTCEMLLQTYQKSPEGHWVVELLPALPREWPTGRVTGLRARGDLEVDLSWNDGVLTAASFRSDQGGTWLVQIGSRTATLVLEPGSAQSWDGNLGQVD